jgi:uncharacterized membrane protein
MAVAVPAAQMQFLLIAIAFSALMTAYVTSDFSLQNVWANSHSAKPLIYKIAGVWGNHEGSMVLWVLILALFGAAVATYGTNLPRELQANVLAVQGSIAAAFLLFIMQPVVRGLHASLEREDDELTETEARKRVALLALRDVEYDFLAGKLDEDDYRSLKGQLTAEALAALEADEAARGTGASAAPSDADADLEAEIARVRAGLRAGVVCSQCGFSNEKGARFCSACGHELTGRPAGRVARR